MRLAAQPNRTKRARRMARGMSRCLVQGRDNTTQRLETCGVTACPPVSAAALHVGNSHGLCSATESRRRYHASGALLCVSSIALVRHADVGCWVESLRRRKLRHLAAHAVIGVQRAHDRGLGNAAHLDVALHGGGYALFGGYRAYDHGNVGLSVYEV